MKALLILSPYGCLPKDKSFQDRCKNIELLVEKFKEAEEPVFVLSKIRDSEGDSIKVYTPQDGNYVFLRKDVDAFFMSGLEKQLRIMGVNEIVICGISLDKSGLFTAISGYDRGFKVTVIKDAVAATNYEYFTLEKERLEETIFKLLSFTDIDTVTMDEFLVGA